jgi:hypothetical protein
MYVVHNAVLLDEKGQQIALATLDAPNERLERTVFCVPIRHLGDAIVTGAPQIEALLLC